MDFIQNMHIYNFLFR